MGSLKYTYEFLFVRDSVVLRGNVSHGLGFDFFWHEDKERNKHMNM